MSFEKSYSDLDLYYLTHYPFLGTLGSVERVIDTCTLSFRRSAKPFLPCRPSVVDIQNNLNSDDSSEDHTSVLLPLLHPPGRFAKKKLDLTMFSSLFREFRHSPCIMAPLTFLGVLLVSMLWIIAFIWKFPIFMLGYFLSPLLNRTQFIIEFFYPFGFGRTVHLMICRMIQKSGIRGTKASDKNRGFHSRSVETRIEVIPDRLFIHPLPQLIDNLGYLVVCCPDEMEVTVINSTIVPSHTPPQIIAFLVDCGDSDAVMEQLDIISEMHYQNEKIHVQSILSTHKHHDHTAGNNSFRRHRANQESFKLVVGGAVENVPCCNYKVADGDIVPLPYSGSNKMADFIEVEAIATPAHTRGSITYALRVNPEFCTRSSPVGFLFTGDTIFSAGGGVPFEADIDPGQEQQEQKKTFTSIVKASASLYAIERCFAEVLARCLKSQFYSDDMPEKMFIMPGHEYTQELLSRQFAVGNASENCRWKNFTPNVFFETVSHMYVAMHRRSLPHSSGKLITAMPSPIRMELSINPYFRNMKRRGEIIIQAINFWHKHFARNKVPSRQSSSYYKNGYSNGNSDSLNTRLDYYSRSTSTDEQWTLDATDLARPVFTTVYSADLDQIIRDLERGNLSPEEGAKQLLDMKERLKEGLVTRRPVPASLPSDRAVYRGLLALALLGSSPSALTFSDSRRMNLPKPMTKSSDQIRISRKHLISVLQWLGLLSYENNGQFIVALIHQLWKETHEDKPRSRRGDKSSNYDTIDPEAAAQDVVELGDLKWQLYGVPRRQSTFNYCMPCAKPRRIDPNHPAHGARMQPHSGEIVRHDIMVCPICRTRAGCPHLSILDNEVEVTSEDKSPSRQVIASIGSVNDEDDGIYVEVTSMLKDAHL